MQAINNNGEIGQQINIKQNDTFMNLGDKIEDDDPVTSVERLIYWLDRGFNVEEMCDGKTFRIAGEKMLAIHVRLAKELQKISDIKTSISQIIKEIEAGNER